MNSYKFKNPTQKKEKAYKYSKKKKKERTAKFLYLIRKGKYFFYIAFILMLYLIFIDTRFHVCFFQPPVEFKVHEDMAVFSVSKVVSGI